MKNILFFTLLLAGAYCNAQNNIPYGNNSAAGKFYDIRGFKMYCEIYGEGQPVLIIHGNGGSISNFEKNIPYFSGKYRVIVADSRAQGRSADPGDSLTYEMMADDLAAQPNIPPSDLHRIHCPALVMGGDHDVIRPEHTLQIAMNITHSYCWILPNSGHSTPVVYSDLFNSTVDDFFAKPYREIKGEGRFN